MIAMKKKSKSKKSKLTKEQLELAQRYEKAWHKLYYQRARFSQQAIIEEPEGRHATELAHEVRVYVDTNEDLKD